MKNTIIVFNTLSSEKYLLCSDGDVAFDMGESNAYKKALMEFSPTGVNVYHLYDAGTKGGKSDGVFTFSKVILVVASSPDVRNFMQYLKRARAKYIWSLGLTKSFSRLTAL